MATDHEFSPDKAFPALLYALGGAALVAGMEIPAIAYADGSFTSGKAEVGGFIAIIGFAFLVGAYNSESLKQLLGAKFTTSVESVALDFRYWVGFVWLVLILASVMVTVGKVRDHRQVVQLGLEFADVRRDLDRYVMPRHLSKSQSSSIAKDLLAHPPFQIEVWSYMNDTESSQYAGDLVAAFKAGGWKATYVPKIDDDLIKENPSAGEGLYIDTIGSPNPNYRPDPDVRSPAQILGEALNNADVRIMGGQGSGNGVEKMILIIAHHPRTYNPRWKMVPVD